MSPKRQPAQWGKIVEVDGFFCSAVMGKRKKSLMVFVWGWFLMKTVRQGLLGDELLCT